MATIKAFTAHTHSCTACGWAVPMIFERGGLGDYVTSKSLKELRQFAEARDEHEAPSPGTYCLTCNQLSIKH